MTRNQWSLPSCQSLYALEDCAVKTVGTPLVSGTVDVPPFDREALITALRRVQAGESKLPEFLQASWQAGEVHYAVDFAARTVSYYGAGGEEYVEAYPLAEVEYRAE